MLHVWSFFFLNISKLIELNKCRIKQLPDLLNDNILSQILSLWFLYLHLSSMQIKISVTKRALGILYSIL